jgi:hypothetical protein
VGKVLGKATSATASSAACAKHLRRHVDLLPEGFDLIFHPRRNVLTMEFAQLEAEIVRILEQARTEASRAAKSPARRSFRPRVHPHHDSLSARTHRFLSPLDFAGAACGEHQPVQIHSHVL